MPGIALIHHDLYALNHFGPRLLQRIPSATLYNTFDDFPLDHPAAPGRLLHYGKAAELAGAELILLTGPAPSELLRQLRPFLKAPILAIDDTAARRAAECGGSITLLGTDPRTVTALREKILDVGAYPPLLLTDLVCREALAARKANDSGLHDRLLCRLALTIKGQDTIVLTEPGMDHLEEHIQGITGCRILSVQSLAITAIFAALQDH